MRPVLALVLASLWIGASLLLALSVAPAAFGTLPSHELAGAVVGQVLRPVFVSGLVGGLIVAGADLQGGSPMGRRARVACAAVWALACGVAQFVLTPRIDTIRRAIGGPIDALARDDVRRAAFDRMHVEIVGVFCLALVAAAVVVILQAVAARPRVSTS
jgi:Domain of unknown function (DUF4149)